MSVTLTYGSDINIAQWYQYVTIKSTYNINTNKQRNNLVCDKININKMNRSVCYRMWYIYYHILNLLVKIFTSHCMAYIITSFYSWTNTHRNYIIQCSVAMTTAKERIHFIFVHKLYVAIDDTIMQINIFSTSESVQLPPFLILVSTQKISNLCPVTFYFGGELYTELKIIKV